MKYLIILFVLFGCQKTSHKGQDTKPIERTKFERLAAKADLYKRLNAERLPDGWPERCDSVGFLALCKTAGACAAANFFDAEQEPGKWQRNKTHDCVETGGSKTSISKDMFVMSWVYALFAMDKATAVGYFQRLEAYGREHDFIMGYPSETVEHLGRVYMTPSMTWTLYSILEKLTGAVPPDVGGLRTAPAGYQGHLRVLDVLVQGFLKGGVDAYEMSDLNDLHDRDPKNALYQAVFHRFRDGQMDEVADILLDEKHWPSDRLPSSAEHCERYLWQRDQGKDWQPCASGDVHDGVDWLFAYWVAGFK